MRRLSISTVVIFTLTCIATVPEVGAARPKRKQRHVNASYTTPAAVVEAAGGGAYACTTKRQNGQANIGCIDIPVKSGEFFVALEISDSAGLPAPAWVVQEDTDYGAPVCGATKEPIPIAAGLPITIWIYPYMADPLCPGVSTTGTVKATFSNVP